MEILGYKIEFKFKVVKLRPKGGIVPRGTNMVEKIMGQGFRIILVNTVKGKYYVIQEERWAYNLNLGYFTLTHDNLYGSGYSRNARFDTIEKVEETIKKYANAGSEVIKEIRIQRRED